MDREDLIYFPAGTTELHQYLAEKQSENFLVNVCVEEDDYKELALHADWMIVAEFVVTEIAAPILAALLADYIISSLRKRADKTNVKSRITVVDDEDKHQVEYYYEGPATEYKEIMVNALSSYSKDKNHLMKKKQIKGKK